VRDDRDAIFAGLIFVFQECPALEGFDAHHIEEICRDELTLDAFRCVAAGEVRAPPALECELFERLALRLPVEIVRHRYFVALNAPAGILVPNCNDAIKVRKIEGLQE
jgi:hypothetical protein